MPLVVDAHADWSALGVVGQCEEDVFLSAVPDEKAAQRSVPQHAVCVLHSQRAPVEATALELGRCVRDDLAVLLAAEGREMGQIHRGDGHRSRVWRWSSPPLKLLGLCAVRAQRELAPLQR